jgi:protein phosphatase
MDPIPDYDIAALTDPGRKRRGDPNQDCVLVVPADAMRGLPPLLIVADGMGGHVGGMEASQKVVGAIAERYQQAHSGDDFLVLLNECLQAAFDSLRRHAAAKPSLTSMGSTAVIAAIDQGQAYIANIGDSRAYHLHGSDMTQVSFDHSVVADQVRAGAITPLQARSHPKRNRLTQSITPKRKEIKPHICQVPFGKDDTLLLCTDGLWGVVTEAMLQAVANDLPPQEAAEKLVKLALSSGGPDNISVIIARRRDARPDLLFSDEDETGG